MLYIAGYWESVPSALDGGDVGRFAPADALAPSMLPLDRDLAARLWW